MTATLLIHATGLAALGFNIAGLVHRCDTRLKRSQGAAALLWAVNNLLLGAGTAAALSAVSASRSATAGLASVGGARARLLSCLAFSGLSLAAGLATWQGWPTLMTTFAAAMTTVALFYFSGQRLRLALLLSAVLWSYNAWALHSLEQMVGNALAIGASALGAWRARHPAPAQSERAAGWSPARTADRHG